MGLYSLGLGLALIVWMLWHLIPMLLGRAWPPGVRERLGNVPERVAAKAAGKRVAWIHAVSVGETLAAQRLVHELGKTLGPDWLVVVSTTTETGQKLAQDRFGAERVFYMPLDFGFAWRRFLQALHPEVIVLMESEVWPRMIYECSKQDVPVVVVNARVSDRSFGRSKRVRWLWGRVLRGVTLWLAQTPEDARRLVEMGACSESVHVGGNLKYDVCAPQDNAMAKRIVALRGTSRFLVAGSTVEGEEAVLLKAWPEVLRRVPEAVLLLTPRHPERLPSVLEEIRTQNFPFVRCSELSSAAEPLGAGVICVLDTMGDLAAVYGVGAAAFVGGSLVKRGGHNPLEPAQFGVPVIMGASFENFRDIVGRMLGADAITIVKDQQELADACALLLTDTEAARIRGQRGKSVFEEQQGATARAVDAVQAMVRR